MRLIINEQPIEGRRLGRHVLHDIQSRSFAAARAPQLKTVVHKAVGLPLEQTRGSCTAEAFCGAMNSAPDSDIALKKHGSPFDQSNADALYDKEIVLEGHDPATDDPGGSGLMVCKAAKQLGWCSSYRHCFGLEHTLEALVLRPVMIGVNWYSSFDDPDPNGVIRLADGATIRGGHEIVLDEINVKAKDVGAWNSWGSGWGYKGRFRMSWELLGRLLQEDGDATIPLP